MSSQLVTPNGHDLFAMAPFALQRFVFHTHQQSGWIFALAACTQTTYRKHMLSPLGTGCSCKRHSCKHILLGHRFTFEAQRLYQLKAWPSSSKPKCHNFRSLIPQRSDHKSVCQHPSCANAAAVSRALVSGYARSHQRTWLTATSATHLLQSEGAWPCQCPISNQPPKLSPRALNQKQTHRLIHIQPQIFILMLLRLLVPLCTGQLRWKNSTL